MTKRIVALLAVLMLLAGFGLTAAAEEVDPAMQIPGGGTLPPPYFETQPIFVPELPTTEPDAEPTVPQPQFQETEPEETQETGETEPEETQDGETVPEETQTGETVAEATEAEETAEASTAAETEPIEETSLPEETEPVQEETCSTAFYFGGAAVIVIVVLLVLLIKEKRRNASAVAIKGIPMQLIAVKGKCKEAGKTLYLDQEMIIGSDPSCDIVWKDPSVSPKHCRLFVSENVIYLEDLNERSGTAIDGMKIYAPNRLRSEDEITIGNVIFKLLF